MSQKALYVRSHLMNMLKKKKPCISSVNSRRNIPSRSARSKTPIGRLVRHAQQTDCDRWMWAASAPDDDRQQAQPIYGNAVLHRQMPETLSYHHNVSLLYVTLLWNFQSFYLRLLGTNVMYRNDILAPLVSKEPKSPEQPKMDRATSSEEPCFCNVQVYERSHCFNLTPFTLACQKLRFCTAQICTVMLSEL